MEILGVSIGFIDKLNSNRFYPVSAEIYWLDIELVQKILQTPSTLNSDLLGSSGDCKRVRD